MAKATLISKGKTKYLAKIRALGGAGAYRDCGAKGGMDVAICLKGLKVKLDESNWADRLSGAQTTLLAWETAMA